MLLCGQFRVHATACLRPKVKRSQFLIGCVTDCLQEGMRNRQSHSPSPFEHWTLTNTVPKCLSLTLWSWQVKSNLWLIMSHESLWSLYGLLWCGTKFSLAFCFFLFVAISLRLRTHLLDCSSAYLKSLKVYISKPIFVAPFLVPSLFCLECSVLDQ